MYVLVHTHLVLGPVPRRVEVRRSLQVSVRDLVGGLRADDVDGELDLQELVTGVPAHLQVLHHTHVHTHVL